MKQFNCIDEYNKYIHQIEDQIKLDESELHDRENMNVSMGKKDIELG